MRGGVEESEPQPGGGSGVNEVVVIGVGLMGWEVRNGDGCIVFVVRVVPWMCPMFVGQPTFGRCWVVLLS